MASNGVFHRELQQRTTRSMADVMDDQLAYIMYVARLKITSLLLFKRIL